MKRWIGPALGGLATVLFGYLFATGDGFWPHFWWGLLGIGAIAETVALTIAAKNDTLSEQVWTETKNPVYRVLLAVFMVWLSWHFTAGRRKDPVDTP